MSRTDSGDTRDKTRKIQEAARNLERAVEELASAATEEVSSGAVRLLDEAAAHVRGTSGSGRQRDREGERDDSASQHGSRRIRYRDYEDLPRRSRALYLDRRNRKIVGVCAGVARYFGIEAWVARCAALTGLIFLPSIVFPAYWVAFFVMGHAPSDRKDARRRGRWVGGYRARERAEKMRRRADERRRAARRGRRSFDGKRKRNTTRNHHSPAPEFGAKFSPRQSLRAAQADMAEVELRLRRMEAFVTSDRYSLERGFAEIGANAAAGSPPDTQTPGDATGPNKEQ